MKSKHLALMGAVSLCGSLLVVVPSGLAAKAMSDKDMDQTTAAGQPRVDVGNGNQTITDNSLYSLSLSGSGQMDVSGDSIANVAGENNIGVGENVANVDGGGEADQLNDIEQTRNATVTANNLNVNGTSTTPAGTSDGTVSADTITATADHIKIGHGDQTEEDNSTYTVDLADQSQQDLVAFSLINAAGRNNVGVALNAANRDALPLTGSGGALTVSQLNTIIQGN